jgi:GNAT superfamily N-acetyltransferase
MSGVTCEVTSFNGSEQQILRLRNANRENPETLAYLRWRYACAPGFPEPSVYWLRSATGERIGMASVIFRPYLVDGQRLPVGIIGDISLEARWRGQGLGKALLRFMTADFERRYPERAALVIPTESARRALQAAGWRAAGRLVPAVCALDPANFLAARLRSAALARALVAPIRVAGRRWVARSLPAHAELHLSPSLMDLPGPIPPQDPESGVATRELSTESLEWRYTRHPHTRFTFATLQRPNEVQALLVYEEADHVCMIYDLLARGLPQLQGLVAAFVLHILARRELITLRIALDQDHPAWACLRRLGFVRRPDAAAFQVHSATGTDQRLHWRLSQGDKDT